jgi:hypothetical protein
LFQFRDTGIRGFTLGREASLRFCDLVRLRLPLAVLA